MSAADKIDLMNFNNNAVQGKNEKMRKNREKNVLKEDLVIFRFKCKFTDRITLNVQQIE